MKNRMVTKPKVQWKTLAVACLIFAQSPFGLERGPDFQSLYMQGMGGTGLASVNGHAALAINPAGLSRRHAEIQKLTPIDLKWAPFKTDFWIHGQHKDIAFSITHDARYDLAVAEAVLTPVLGVGARSDLVFTVGRGMVLENDYRIGFAFKYLYRLEFPRRLVGTTDREFFVVKDRLESDRSTLSKLLVASEVANTRHGIGMNFGVIKEFHENWRWAVALNDFPTIMSFQFTKPEIKVGVQYHYDFALNPEIGNRLTVNAELHRFLIPNVAWFHRPKVGMSLESYRGERQLGYINFGFNDGYPTFGARAGYFVYLGYTYYTQELGGEPGQKPLSFHKIFLEAEI